MRCAGPAQDTASLCEAEERQDELREVFLEQLFTADGDFEQLREPITESVRTWEKMADAVDDAEEERLFLQYAQPLKDTLDSMASDPPRMPPSSDVPPLVSEDIRALLLERCDVDIDPSDLGPLEEDSLAPTRLTQ